MSDFNVGFVIFPDITQLDFTGPFEVLSRLATPPSISVPSAFAGLVTRTEFSGVQFGSANSGSGRGCGSPSPERFVSEDAERAAGGEMALDVEGVEDYGVNR